jgi:hypothetical protein
MALSDNLLVYWAFSEASGDRADLSGNGQTLTDDGSLGSTTGLIYPLAGNFIRASVCYAKRFPVDAYLQMGNNDNTVVSWVKLTSKPAGVPTIVMKGNRTADYEWRVFYYTTGDRFVFEIFEGAARTVESQVSANTFGSPSTGVWYMVTAQHDAVNDTIGIGVNAGAMDTNPTSNLGPFPSTEICMIGTERNGTEPDVLMDGVMGPIIWWKRKLSGAELTQVYNGGAGLTFDQIGGRRFLLVR